MSGRIKNYTSSVPVGRTVQAVEDMLAEAGASDIRKSYHAGSGSTVPRCLWFAIDVAGQRYTFKLPVDVGAVFAELSKPPKDVARRRRSARTAAQERALLEQAARTAWRLTYDLVAVQLAFIRLSKAPVLQVFLPYLYDERAGLTFYEIAESRGQLKLSGGGA